jgi:hypothetical protein
VSSLGQDDRPGITEYWCYVHFLFQNVKKSFT